MQWKKLASINAELRWNVKPCVREYAKYDADDATSSQRKAKEWPGHNQLRPLSFALGR